MLKRKWLKSTEWLCRRYRLILLFLPCILLLSLYIVFRTEMGFQNLLSIRACNPETEKASALKSHSIGHHHTEVDEFLVWNSKCHMLSINPMDPSITKFVKKNKFESCAETPLLSYISKDPVNGSIFLAINSEVANSYKNPVCCWAPIIRPTPSKPPKGAFDTDISVGKCKDFETRVLLPEDIEIIKVNCRKWLSTVYENVHAIINPARMQNHLDRLDELKKETTNEGRRTSRKLSVLVLGIDSVSRLNFKRSMPRTERYLTDTDWLHLRGYNKVGENTVPNLIAILGGLTYDEFCNRCRPETAYGLDNCPMLWYNFRNVSYVTAHGEDLIDQSTFNYWKVGFVDPPTNYYMRPYLSATEKLLKSRTRFNNKYCTGPEVSFERVFNYAREFARTFIKVPYFGFFWSNSVTHDDVNGLSSMDDRMLDVLEGMERDGIMNDTMIIFLSDHGMRWGDIRTTFVGWYEERLPFIYIRLPDWFHAEEPEAYEALRMNEHRLTSPYDLYETLREVLIRSGGEANSSFGCKTCQSLFRPVPLERGCDDAGVPAHWCTCTAFKPGSTSDEIAVEGTRKFLEHAENIIKQYKDSNGKRLCSRLKLKKIHRVDKLMDIQHDNDETNVRVGGYFYLIEVSPGGARYEATIRYHGGNNFTVNEREISRVNSYGTTANCLNHGSKHYCHCA